MSDGDSEMPAQEEEEEILAGEDALVYAADMLYQRLQKDASIAQHLENIDLNALATKLRNLLNNVFNGDNWPQMLASPSLINDCYQDFFGIILETLDEVKGDDALLSSLDALTHKKGDDERLQRFFEHIRGSAYMSEEGAEDEHGEEGNAEGDATADTKEVAGADISTSTFGELRLQPTTAHACNEAWRLFVSTASSREAAGEAIYGALFEAAPSLQKLFVTPRAVQAMRFMNGLASFVETLIDPPRLKVLVETLGFGHLHLDVTVPRVVIFRDAILDLFIVELADRFSSEAQDGYRKLLNYVGGAIIFVKAHYAERISCLLKSWKQANHGDQELKNAQDSQAASDSGENTRAEEALTHTAHKSKKWRWNLTKQSTATNSINATAGATAGKELKGTEAHANTLSSQSIPTTFPEMFMFNAAVMGFGKNAWMNEVLACFDNIVKNVANSNRLQEECDILSLRIAKVVKGSVNLADYKSCMLASLRSLLPKDWESSHEVAWTWLWENVERLVMRVHGQPPVWEHALRKTLESLDEDQKFEIRKDIYATFFTTAPAGQDFFKQSNTYLHIVADKVLAMTLELYQNPVKMVDDISALGLRHVGYAIPTELFGPFVSACVEVLMRWTKDETVVDSFRWSLGLISKMLVRTITEGSTIVMKAINANSQKMLQRAIGCAPRGERAAWMLLVQVGTQSISPLAWSVEAGNFEAAVAILKDLLTFRADRVRYYYGMDELFKRHPDIIKMLCDQSPDLVPKLLDGLIWRSRNTEVGMRRVNYYVKHMLVDEDGSFSKTLAWIAKTRDPKLVCHPVIVLVADIIWTKVAYRSFLYGKSWFFFTLLVFITSQSVLQHLHHDGKVERSLVFGCRSFIYVLSMTQLICSHLRDTVAAYRQKDTIRICGIRIPRYLRQWQDAANLLLTICLIAMLCLEPILWCWSHQNGKMFLEHCEEKMHLRFSYSVFSMIAMFLYYVLLMDLTVVSTRISAFSLVCIKMLNEVTLFLGALLVATLTFSSSLSALEQHNQDFAGIHNSAYALFRIVMSTYDAKRYADLVEEPVLLFMVFIFGVITVIFFLNMLIAQLSCAYSSVYEDMVGYARLERADTIVEIMPSVPLHRWHAFIDSLRLHKRLEFNQGDIGVPGGIRMKEAANINPTTVDMIRRFGGSTSAEIQWPEDDADVEVDKFERIEKLIQRTLKRITKSGGHNRHAGGYSGTGTGTGTGTGSGKSSSEDHDD